ncbi:hypothetical protein LVJ94_51730 [Pendulispora rubella]|uniref:ATP synthase subunit 4, mitochondrial n=1 Tax=Pendulispora rubella TaxID=2741070 RepID=A0ABZ2L3P8_9BACT
METTSTEKIPESHGPPKSCTLVRWAKAIFGPQRLSIFGCIGAIVYFGAIAKDAVILAEVLTFGMAMLVLVRFPGISKLKAFGLEFEQVVKAKEEAETAVAHALASADQLRTVASTLGRLALDSVAMAGRLASLSISDQMSIRNDVASTLASAGCGQEEIDKAAILLDRTCRFDLVNRIIQLAGEFAGWSQEFQKQTNALKGLDEKGSFIRGQERFSVADAGKVREVLAQYKITDPRVLRRWREYERYENEQIPPDIEGDEDEQSAVIREIRGSNGLPVG